MYNEREDVGLGYLPAIGVMVGSSSPNILTDPRFSATRFGLPGGPAPAPEPKKAPKPTEKPPPPPPEPSVAAPIVSETGSVPPPSQPTTVTGGGGEWGFTLPGTQTPTTGFAPGDVNVTLGGSEAPKGFGLVEAAIAAGLAALLATSLSRKKR